jgi:hypothetical protein
LSIQGPLYSCSENSLANKHCGTQALSSYVVAA